MRTLSLLARWFENPSAAGVALCLCLGVLLGSALAVTVPWAVGRWFALPGALLTFLWLVWATWRACRPVRPMRP